MAVLGLCWFNMGETHKTPSRTFAEQFRSYPALLGICPGLITAGFVFGNFLSGRFAASFELRASSFELRASSFELRASSFELSTMIIAGRLVASGGLLLSLLLLWFGQISPWSLFGSTIFVGIGNELTMPSSNAGAMSVQPELAGSAAGLAGALIVAGGAVLTSITGSLLDETNTAYALLGIVTFCSLAGLLATVDVRRSSFGSS